MESFIKTLESYMDAQFPILYVDTMEYDQIENDVMDIAQRGLSSELCKKVQPT